MKVYNFAGPCALELESTGWTCFQAVTVFCFRVLGFGFNGAVLFKHRYLNPDLMLETFDFTNDTLHLRP